MVKLPLDHDILIVQIVSTCGNVPPKVTLMFPLKEGEGLKEGNTNVGKDLHHLLI